MSGDLTSRMGELGAVLAMRMPNVLIAAIMVLEAMARALDAVRPERYEIQRAIGAGGQAEVLLGVVRGVDRFERPVAIKRVRADLPEPARGRYSTMLAEEARFAAALWHPNLISIFDFERDAAGWPFLVMEYIDGVDLATLVETGPLPHAAVIFIVSELLAGLGYLHERHAPDGDRTYGLVHRDVTPHNVRLSWEGAVKLVDLGLAQILRRRTTAPAAMPLGTTGYLSPEQASGEPLDGRSDLYAVGIVLWELLAARRLRVGPAGWRPVEVAFEAIPRPSEHRPDMPADLEAVAMRLLAVHPDDRYPTAERAARDLVGCQSASREGRAELVRLLADRFPRARRGRSGSRLTSRGLPSNGRITAPEPSAPPSAPSASALVPQESGDHQRRPGAVQRARRGWRWALAIGVLLALALATIALLGGR